jgi:hypothetical protein
MNCLYKICVTYVNVILFMGITGLSFLTGLRSDKIIINKPVEFSRKGVFIWDSLI